MTAEPMSWRYPGYAPDGAPPYPWQVRDLPRVVFTLTEATGQRLTARVVHPGDCYGRFRTLPAGQEPLVEVRLCPRVTDIEGPSGDPGRPVALYPARLVLDHPDKCASLTQPQYPHHLPAIAVEHLQARVLVDLDAARRLREILDAAP